MMQVPAFLRQKSVHAAVAVVLALLVYSILPGEEAVKRTAAVFVIAAAFWSLEIVALHATSLLVVALLILGLSPPTGATDVSYKDFMFQFGNNIIILFMGGFILAKAMSKFEIDRIIARNLMRVLGTKPFWVMFGLMATTGFLSIWMSNTATTAMMVAMINPLVDQFDRDDKFRTALVLAVPVGANIGGIGTPVGTPPNAIAMGLLANEGIAIDFFSWMILGVPIAVTMMLFSAALLFFMFPSKHDSVVLDIPEAKSLDWQGWTAVGIALLTVVLWLTGKFHGISSATVALVAATLFAVTGLMGKKEFKSLDWDILILMWGGLALGLGMQKGGLTTWIVDLPMFQQEGLVLLVLASVVGLAIATFMSHTATANLLIPVVIAMMGVGAASADKASIAILVAVATSFAMAFPVSTPPNAIAFSLGVISVKDLAKAGGLISIVGVIMLLLVFRHLIPFVL